jgi:hypothetical protein
MLDRIDELDATSLNADQYLEDFWPHFEKIEDVFWKLERQQHFQEPDSPSWQAANAGDWEQALRLVEETRGSVSEHYQKMRQRGIVGKRLRIVERPFSRYLQWEMYNLKVRCEEGEQTRVVDAGHLYHLEFRGKLPELVVLGRRVAYLVIYDSSGLLAGARRIADPAFIDDCRTDLARLHDKGEPLETFFTREIAPLAPPEHLGT